MEFARERVMQYPGDALLNGELAMALHANRRFQEAAVMYDRARKIHPSVFRWEYYRGLVLAELNEVAEAGASFRRALELRENEPNALIALAQLYYKSAKLADNEALEAEGDRTLDRLIEDEPGLHRRSPRESCTLRGGGAPAGSDGSVPAAPR